MDCIFCKIVAGEIPSFKVHEDNDVLAFMDIKPVTKGHCLVIPKKHAENIFDIPEDVLQKVMVAGKKLAVRLKDVLRADGIRLSQSNGKTAGQEVMHFHLHVIPRHENDGVHIGLADTLHSPQADFEELKKTAEQIKM